MSFPNSPGAYGSINDISFVVNSGGVVAGGIVISAPKGPTTVNIVTSAKQFVDQYGLPSSDNPSMYAALRFLNRAGILAVRRVINNAVTAFGTLVSGATTQLTVYGANPGAWANSITVSFGTIIGAPSGVFALIVKNAGVEVERFEVSRSTTQKDGYGRNLYIEDVVNNRSLYIRVDDNPAASGSYSMSATISLTGGLNDTVAPTSGMINTAWDDFLNTESVPATLLINAGWAVAAVQQKMVAVATARKDAVAILDMPAGTTVVADMITYKNTLAVNSYFGGIYGGWVKIYDQYNDKEVLIPPSGDVAAAFVRTFEDYERWEAPAGLRRGIIPNALGVSVVFSEGDRDLLYTNGINPVTTLGGAAAVIWGQKTLQAQASALDRFNVVNNVLWMQQRCVEALQPFVFQSNTEFTRNNVKFILDAFLENIQQRDGLYGFFVDVSEEINTPQVIDNNQMFIDCYVKPVRTAEFIRFRLNVTPTGVELG